MARLEPTHTLLATLGGQPQVVTFTLDLLLRRGIPIREVIVVHPASYDRLQHAIACLNAEFPGDRYRVTGEPIRFRRYILQQYNAPIDDIVDDRSADGVLNAMNDLIRDLKQQGRTIHFSITGGRRLMGFLSFSAALLNFEHTDRLWHIHTPQDVKKRVRDGAYMHVELDDNVQLIEVPFARLAQPVLSRLLNAESANARTIIDMREEQEKAEQQQRSRELFARVTSTQRKVLQLFLRGLTPQEVAAELDVSIKTVSSHTTVLLRECRNIWNIPEHKKLDYHFFVLCVVPTMLEGPI
ncbi:MAG: CRISPR-associated ring nuclease [Ktedonobacteraceae bacterium]